MNHLQHVLGGISLDKCREGVLSGSATHTSHTTGEI